MFRFAGQSPFCPWISFSPIGSFSFLFRRFWNLGVELDAISALERDLLLSTFAGSVGHCHTRLHNNACSLLSPQYPSYLKKIGTHNILFTIRCFN